MEAAQTLVHSAPSLVSSLDDDTLATIVEHVSGNVLCGRWKMSKESGEVREDGHYQKTRKSVTIWLRKDGAAQFTQVRRVDVVCGLY